MSADSPCLSTTPTFARPADSSYLGLHNNIFRPPLTPGTPLSATPSRAYSFLLPGQDLSVTRKRLRARQTSTKVTASTAQGTFTNGPEGDSWVGSDYGRATSPAPLANTAYALSGGFDTPTLAAAAYYDRPGHAAEFDFRKRWDADAESPLPLPDYVDGGPLARERNGHSRMTSGSYDDHDHDQPQAGGWGTFVFSLASTVAGKMWSFCRESAFRGFHAGEGKGYDFTQPTHLDSDRSWDGYFRAHTPVPGQYPRERDFSRDFEQDSTPARPRPSKRLHTDTGNGWLVVDSNLDTREDSPRLTARKVSNPLLSAGRPPASRASSRRSLIPVSRRSNSAISMTGSPQQQQPGLDKATLHPAFPASGFDRRASTASTRAPFAHARNSSHSSRPTTANGSPLTPEAKRYLAKKDREDKEAEKSMRKMNKQLQDLIRQGQAALGTRIEVDHDHVDEGFEDGDAEAWEDAGAEAAFATKW